MKEINYFKNPMKPNSNLGRIMDSILDDREAQKEEIIDNLTDHQTALLTAFHARGYHGTDDDMPDAFEDWLMRLSVNELETILCLKK